MQSTEANPIVEHYGKFREDDRSFDVRFWQRQGPAAIFDAAWAMVVDSVALRGGDAEQLRLQRTVESFHRTDAAWSRREEVDLNGLAVPFIGKEDLIRAKLAAAREQDLLDAKRLLQANSGAKEG